MKVFQNSIYSVEYIDSSNTIKFNWEEGHKSMSYEDFQHACSNFIGFGFEYGASRILIDVRNFQFQLPSNFPEWQEKEHYPRYYKLGIEKVAYVMPIEYLEHAKEITKEPGKFELKNFSDIESAFKYFN
ncbi:MAG: hypothetical protein AAGK97_10620 [Bacteroidota bacterium]